MKLCRSGLLLGIAAVAAITVFGSQMANAAVSNRHEQCGETNASSESNWHDGDSPEGERSGWSWKSEKHEDGEEGSAYTGDKPEDATADDELVWDGVADAEANGWTKEDTDAIEAWKAEHPEAVEAWKAKQEDADAEDATADDGTAEDGTAEDATAEDGTAEDATADDELVWDGVADAEANGWTKEDTDAIEAWKAEHPEAVEAWKAKHENADAEDATAEDGTAEDGTAEDGTAEECSEAGHGSDQEADRHDEEAEVVD